MRGQGFRGFRGVSGVRAFVGFADFKKPNAVFGFLIFGVCFWVWSDLGFLVCDLGLSKI